MLPFDPVTVPLPGIHLVEASAGTGKTHNITTLFLRLLVEQRLEVGQILVVTFTRAATAELRDRIRKRLRDAIPAFRDGGSSEDEDIDRLVRTRAAQGGGSLEQDRLHLVESLRSFDEASIFTIHGFCQRMLQENAFESGSRFDTELTVDESTILAEVVDDFWTSEVCGAGEIFYRFLGLLKYSKSRLESLATTAVRHRRAPVLVDQGEDVLESCWDRYVQAWNEAFEIWRSERETVREILHRAVEDADLKKTYCGGDHEKLDRWLGDVDALLGGDAFDNLRKPPLARRNVVGKFTPSGLLDFQKKGRTVPANPFFDAFERLFTPDSVLRAAARRRLDKLRCDLVMHARCVLEERKRRAGVQSFDDLLHDLANALEGPSAGALADVVRGRFHAALIDEFQDTDPVQYEIFGRVYGGTESSLFLIGDPKQSIYAFRGADVFSYMRAKRDAGAERTCTLGTNWRSDPSLIRAVNTMFGRVEKPFVFEQEGIGFESVGHPDGRTDRLSGPGPALEILLHRREEAGCAPLGKAAAWRDLPGLTSAEISRFLASGRSITDASDRERNVEAGDVAVLVRTNLQALDMQAALRRLRIPSVLHSQASVLESAEALEFEQVLRAVSEPANPGTLKQALSTSLFGLGGRELAVIQDEDEAAWEAWIQGFQEWRELWTRGGFIQAFRRMLDRHSIQKRLLGLVDGERRLTNVLHLGEILHVAASGSRMGLDGLVQWFARVRGDRSGREEVAEDERQIRLESDAHAIQIVTIHRSKGLEYPVVYCPYLWDGKLHPPALHAPALFHVQAGGGEQDHELRIDLGLANREEVLSMAAREEFAEHLRVLYVAVTRAKHRCTLVWGGIRDSCTSALGYLLFQEDDGGDPVRATSARILEMSDDDMAAGLDELASASGSTIGWRDLPREGVTVREAGEAVASRLDYRRPMPFVEGSWSVTSFSKMSSSARSVSRPAAEGIDHDEASGVEPGERPAEQPPTPDRIRLHGFPKGAGPGSFIHDVFEHLDFEEHGARGFPEFVGERLARFGFDADRWKQTVADAVSDTLVTALPALAGGDPFSLSRVPLSHRLTEMEFIFPVAGSGRKLTVAALASAFEGRTGDRVPAGYHEDISHLGFPDVNGFLRGFVDLVFEHEGRWYVLDYKSNHLGDMPGDYRADRLAEAMVHHHYVLQYSIYTVALHRHLGRAIEGYSYETHFGGVYYLFVRGMSPAYPPGNGVFHDRPGEDLVEALCAALEASP
ncbi:MAG: exodeoxyribonuclease V subunit beta [Deltaproteobacteria bacterium]|nr:exodeoxyribonuclease V subunit beta [Deltaproteobacteria bacterium]